MDNILPFEKNEKSERRRTVDYLKSEQFLKDLTTINIPSLEVYDLSCEEAEQLLRELKGLPGTSQKKLTSRLKAREVLLPEGQENFPIQIGQVWFLTFKQLTDFEKKLQTRVDYDNSPGMSDPNKPSVVAYLADLSLNATVTAVHTKSAIATSKSAKIIPFDTKA